MQDDPAPPRGAQPSVHSLARRNSSVSDLRFDLTGFSCFSERMQVNEMHQLDRDGYMTPHSDGGAVDAVGCAGDTRGLLRPGTVHSIGIWPDDDSNHAMDPSLCRPSAV